MKRSAALWLRMWVLAWLAGVCAPVLAQVKLLPPSATALAHGSGDEIVFTARVARKGQLTLKLLSADRDIVRQWTQPVEGPGEYRFRWDGRDDLGQAVPDEAYTPMAEWAGEGSPEVDDPAAMSGGEVLEDTPRALVGQGDIAYELSAPARVLIRVGVKGGAMMRSLAVWAPRPAGRNLQRWNGFDEDGVVDLRNDRLAILVAAFRLPNFAVITSGNPGASYRDYRRSRQWKELPDSAFREAASKTTERNGMRVARQHFAPRYKDREPRVTVSLADADGKPLSPRDPVATAVRVTVDLFPEDRWLLEETLYEVAFFIDGEFVSEEENGYVPISWLWNTQALPPGPHLLTVNITGFTGRVGTRTLQFLK